MYDVIYLGSGHACRHRAAQYDLCFPDTNLYAHQHFDSAAAADSKKHILSHNKERGGS